MPTPDRSAQLSPLGTTPGTARASSWRRLDPFAVVGVIIYAVIGLVAIFADQLVTHDPLQILFTPEGGLADNLPISAEHYLGTTNMGRDIYSQLILGTRSAIVVGLSAAFVVVVIGTLVGLLSGFFGGVVDMILMRAADVALGIPFLPFVIVLAGFLEPSLWNVVLAMALLVWPTTGRVIRSQVLTLRQRAFVEAARVSGASDMRILFVHVMPNILPLALVYGSISIGWAILTEASISFLGFGPSDSISWGTMLQDAYISQALSRGWYRWFVPPGICIILIVVAGFFISRGFEEVFFPRLRD
jgi:peptide/nickel transport system permease protein